MAKNVLEISFHFYYRQKKTSKKHKYVKIPITFQTKIENLPFNLR